MGAWTPAAVMDRTASTLLHNASSTSEYEYIPCTVHHLGTPTSSVERRAASCVCAIFDVPVAASSVRPVPLISNMQVSPEPSEFVRVARVLTNPPIHQRWPGKTHGTAEMDVVH